ncbi:MAG: pyruvate dehydrogenase (acetyl-transferring), homodimeric type [Candidatus Methylumidiphilus sp.]
MPEAHSLPSTPVQDDLDPTETREWLDALAAVIETEGAERAHYLIERLVDKARRSGINLPYKANTAYLNTITPQRQPRFPGNAELEHRIRSYIRWNAMAMVVKANKVSSEYGGHIASFASSATLYEIGFNHFFRGAGRDHGGDLIFFQGHSSPGIYARAFMEGRLTEEHLSRFRHEVNGNGLSSYPHPWLMPDFWQFPTVSMGLGPIMAIYQANFMQYLQGRGILQTEDRKVWAFMGDGEMDEPESRGAIGLAGREKLDNLIFVINCNLQRLDGPVRGDGKIIQELEGEFRGAGWNVIKVIWGSGWDDLLARDTQGLLRKRMEEVVDGEYQAYKAKDGAFVREQFFGKYPELRELVAHMSNDDIFRLKRGGHDIHKVFAAYHEAVNHKGQPTVILAKTVKGYGMGSSGEGQMTTHQQKKIDEAGLRQFRDRFNIPIPDDKIAEAPFYKPAEDSPEMLYLHERRKALGGYLPARRREAPLLQVPDLAVFDALLKKSDREMSTTMAFVRILTTLLRDHKIGKYVVPIVADEARTFGMDGLFRQYAIYSSVGQLYTPQDSDQLMFYREATSGQILQEGICEAGAMSSWIAAGTAYTNHHVQMIPFYIYYSMFGFQRVGDLMWAAGDMQARGFLLGGTAGRTTLAGEGLQHQDGHSHMAMSFIPNCVAYDPAFAHELAVVVQDGLRRMYQEGENIFYYVTVMNENHDHPGMPEGVAEGIIKGIYQLEDAGDEAAVQLLGSGAILRETLAAAALLEEDFGIKSNVWSVTSFSELRRDGLDKERCSLLHPDQPRATSYLEDILGGMPGPIVAASDYMKVVADQVRQFLPGKTFTSLGTDGYGRSDRRSELRRFFEVNRHYIVLAALKALADEGTIDVARVVEAMDKYGIDPNKPNPATV